MFGVKINAGGQDGLLRLLNCGFVDLKNVEAVDRYDVPLEGRAGYFYF